jgi:hypothetical protein
MAGRKRVSLNALLERKAKRLRERLAAVERLIGNPDFILVFGEQEDPEDESVLGVVETEATKSKPRPKPAHRRIKPKEKKSDFAQKRGTRGDSIERVLAEAEEWLDAETIMERLPGVGYAPKWDKPYANVKALIQEEARKGVHRIAMRDGKFGLTKWPEPEKKTSQ